MAYEARNNKIIIKPIDSVTTLENGMVIQESRGKKDILVGEVVLSPIEWLCSAPGCEAVKTYRLNPGTLVWYPEYSSLPITLDGERLYVIDYEDIILIKEKEGDK